MRIHDPHGPSPDAFSYPRFTHFPLAGSLTFVPYCLGEILLLCRTLEESLRAAAGGSQALLTTWSDFWGFDQPPKQPRLPPIESAIPVYGRLIEPPFYQSVQVAHL